MSSKDFMALEQGMSRLAQEKCAGKPQDWSEGYAAAIDDVRRLFGSGPGLRTFEVSGHGFPPFGITGVSGQAVAETLAGFAKAALASNGKAPLFLVRDPLERVRRIEPVQSEMPLSEGRAEAAPASIAGRDDSNATSGNGKRRNDTPSARRVLLALTLVERPHDEITDANCRFLKPRIDILSFEPREADPETDELINLAVVIRDVVDVGELDADFDEVREIMGIGGLPPGVTDAPDDNGRIGNRRGLRVAYVNPDPNPNDGKREED